MTDRPMIFSAPMIRALIEGRKTQTRRLVKGFEIRDPRGDDIYDWFDLRKKALDEPAWVGAHKIGQPLEKSSAAELLPWRVGDLIWVRETFQTAMSDGGPCWLYRADYDRFYPEFDGPDEGIGPSFNYEKYPANYSAWAADVEARGPWRSPIHMPRWASRLTLTVTDVRVQRLQEISEADADAEGISQSPLAYGIAQTKIDGKTRYGLSACDLYRDLWNSLHGADAWSLNPCVAALTFTVERRNIDAPAAAELEP